MYLFSLLERFVRKLLSVNFVAVGYLLKYYLSSILMHKCAIANQAPADHYLVTLSSRGGATGEEFSSLIALITSRLWNLILHIDLLSSVK